MTIKIKFSSGKEIELTQYELAELNLLGIIKQIPQQIPQQIPVFPMPYQHDPFDRPITLCRSNT